MQFRLTRQSIEAAFDLLGTYAAEKGLAIEIAVYGGSCLILATDIRLASGDVDAVYLSDRAEVASLAAKVAQRLKMPDNWLNEAVKRMAPPAGNPSPTLLPFGDYPRDTSTGIGLRVYLPTPEYMLAMKILANRHDDDAAKIQQDQNDAIALMQITGIKTREGLTDLLRQCYPQLPGLMRENGPMPRIDAKIETLIDAYEADPNRPVPAWNAGRGSPTRSDSWER